MDVSLLGYPTLDSYFDQFLKTLLPSNKTFDYFVDWNKIYDDVNHHKIGISLLQSLTRESKQTIRSSFLSLLREEQDRILPIIPLLLAVRVANEPSLSVFDTEAEKIFNLTFRPPLSSDDEERLLYFMEKTRIFDLLINTQNIYDYILGVNVGLDSNARKNRSGKIFERMILSLLDKHLPPDFRLIREDRGFSLYVSGKKRIKRHDFVLYYREKQIAVFETNFYNTSGSKPESIAESYTRLSSEASRKGLHFVWITDGAAWEKMKNSLRHALPSIDFVFNYYLIKKHIKELMSLFKRQQSP